MFNNFKIIAKNRLADDVFEIILSTDGKTDFLAGQFLLIDFDINGQFFKKPYSVVSTNGDKITLLVKNAGNGGSFFCSQEVGKVFKGVFPLGKFILTENKVDTLFLCTGVGFAPIFSQIEEALNKKKKKKIILLFGVRYGRDIFYEEKLRLLKKKYDNFDYKIFLSREEKNGYEKGYISQFLETDEFCKFEEFYLCGSAKVVIPIVSLLKQKGKSGVYFECY